MNFINKIIVSSIPLLPKSIIQLFSKKYVAGINHRQALNVIKKINKDGQSATIDILGEHTSTKRDCESITNEYIELLKEIHLDNLDCNLSIKPTHIGADINYQTVLKNFKKILETADRFDNFIRIDMENSKLTDTSIKLYKDLKSISDNIGIVFQAYLHRTEDDILKLEKDANIRLCKGIYKEVEDIAYQDYHDINRNYLKLLKIALQKGNYVGIATHDKNLIQECIDMIDYEKISENNFEFQYLYGVPMVKTIHIYKKKNFKVRSYVPFGKDWYNYSIRRIKENPKIASYVIKNILSNN